MRDLNVPQNVRLGLVLPGMLKYWDLGVSVLVSHNTVELRAVDVGERAVFYSDERFPNIDEALYRAIAMCTDWRLHLDTVEFSLCEI